MKNFFDKMKEGAAEAAKLAQQTVEVTKLKTQISSKQKEQDVLFASIGREVYRAYQERDLSMAEEFISNTCEEIERVQQEIRALEWKIREIKNEKECGCGRMVPADAKFCPSCGAKFEDPRPVEPAATQTLCPSCGTVNEPAFQFCRNCGTKLDDAKLTEGEPAGAEADAVETQAGSAAAPRTDEEPGDTAVNTDAEGGAPVPPDPDKKPADGGTEN